MSFPFAPAFGAAALLLALSAGIGLAHEGHDDGAQPTLAPANVAPRGEAASPELELVAVAQGAELFIYLDRFATNAPITGATVEVETPDGPKTATPAGEAYRLVAPWLAKPGHVDLIFTVTAGGNVDVLPLSLDIPAGPDAAASAAGAGVFAGPVKALMQPAVLFAVGFGLLAGFALTSVRRRRRTAAIVLAGALALLNGAGLAREGETHTEPKPAVPAVEPAALTVGSERAARGADGAIFAPKSIQRIFGLRTALVEAGTHRRSIELPGRIIPDPNASGYVQTAIGGRLSAPPGGFPRLGTAVRQGDVLAYVTPPMQAIDVSDMRQRQGELDQQVAIVERRLARYEQLAPSGAIARFQLEETKLELEGLKERRAQIDKVRREPEALIAPVAGVIADGTPIAGQIAQSNAIIFHIIDPARLWIEALSYEAIADAKGASATTANGRNLLLAFRGSGSSDRSQSIPVHFAIEGDTGGLRAGQFVTVFVTTGEEKQGLAVPRSGLVRGSDGQDYVFEHTTAERFEPRPVRAEPLDGEQVLISAGITPGKRIVIQGAELLDHVR